MRRNDWRTALDAAQRDTQSARSAMVPLQQRNAELEGLLAPPPDGRGIRHGMYYRTTDAAKHKTITDALLHQDVLDLVAQGETEATATRLIAHGWRRQKDGE
jgi:hypothetical protein